MDVKVYFGDSFLTSVKSAKDFDGDFRKSIECFLYLISNNKRETQLFKFGECDDNPQAIFERLQNTNIKYLYDDIEKNNALDRCLYRVEIQFKRPNNTNGGGEVHAGNSDGPDRDDDDDEDGKNGVDDNNNEYGYISVELNSLANFQNLYQIYKDSCGPLALPPNKIVIRPVFMCVPFFGSLTKTDKSSQYGVVSQLSWKREYGLEKGDPNYVKFKTDLKNNAMFLTVNKFSKPPPNAAKHADKVFGFFEREVTVAHTGMKMPTSSSACTPIFPSTAFKAAFTAALRQYKIYYREDFSHYIGIDLIKSNDSSIWLNHSHIKVVKSAGNDTNKMEKKPQTNLFLWRGDNKSNTMADLVKILSLDNNNISSFKNFTDLFSVQQTKQTVVYPTLEDIARPDFSPLTFLESENKIQVDCKVNLYDFFKTGYDEQVQKRFITEANRNIRDRENDLMRVFRDLKEQTTKLAKVNEKCLAVHSELHCNSNSRMSDNKRQKITDGSFSSENSNGSSDGDNNNDLIKTPDGKTLCRNCNKIDLRTADEYKQHFSILDDGIVNSELFRKHYKKLNTHIDAVKTQLNTACNELLAAKAVLAKDDLIKSNFEFLNNKRCVYLFEFGVEYYLTKPDIGETSEEKNRISGKLMLKNVYATPITLDEFESSFQ